MLTATASFTLLEHFTQKAPLLSAVISSSDSLESTPGRLLSFIEERRTADVFSGLAAATLVVDPGAMNTRVQPPPPVDMSHRTLATARDEVTIWYCPDVAEELAARIAAHELLPRKPQ
jgi:hypothetical protein